jgi:hypothetical protein
MRQIIKPTPIANAASIAIIGRPLPVLYANMPAKPSRIERMMRQLLGMK